MLVLYSASSVFWISSVFCARCTSRTRCIGPEQEGFQQFLIQNRIISSSHQAFGWNITITLLSYSTCSVKGIRLPLPWKVINGFTRHSPSANSVIRIVHWCLSSPEPPLAPTQTSHQCQRRSLHHRSWKAVGFGPCWLLGVGSIGPKVQPSHPQLLFGGCHDEIAEQPNAYPLALSGRCWWLASHLFGGVPWSPKTIHWKIGSWYLAPARWQFASHVDKTTIPSPSIPSSEALCTPMNNFTSISGYSALLSKFTYFLCCFLESFYYLSPNASPILSSLKTFCTFCKDFCHCYAW